MKSKEKSLEQVVRELQARERSQDVQRTSVRDLVGDPMGRTVLQQVGSVRGGSKAVIKG